MKFAFCLALVLCLTACCRPASPAYRTLYKHLENQPVWAEKSCCSDYFLILYVNARHLDYTDNYSFLNTLAGDGRTRDFGHAWIYLQGIKDGNRVYVCGGHSGELGIVQAKYFDGIMNYIDYGYANPTEDQCLCPRYEPNPVKYLWDTLKDGYFECGSGGHIPTFAAKVEITQEQFEAILGFVQNYDFTSYTLTSNQCSSFVAQAALLAGLEVNCEITMPINKELHIFGERIRLWEDPAYSRLTISSPDIIERSLMDAVKEGRALWTR